MLFAIGTRVELLHTGETGTVRALLGDNMVSVYIEAADMEIPVSTDDLTRAEVTRKKPVKAKIVEGKKTKSSTPPPAIPIETQYTILKSQGVQLAFEPSLTPEGITEKFAVFLINDTKYEVIFTIKFLANYRKPITWAGKVEAVNGLYLGDMQYDDLNESPEFEIECRWVTTESVGEPLRKVLKIKAKSFFKNFRMVPLLNRQAHLYRLFEKPESRVNQEAEDLTSYTKRHIKSDSSAKVYHEKVTLFDSKEVAEFHPEIDLHIHKLHQNWEKLKPAEILRIQMQHFDEFLSKAIRLGIPRVFIIHGVGQGRLRQEIAARLSQNPDISAFKNEFHPKYGWGATEVIL